MKLKEEANKRPAFTMRSSILRKTTLLTMLVTTVTALSLAIATYIVTTGILEQRVVVQLGQLADAKELLLSQRIASDRQRTQLLAAREAVQNAFTRNTKTNLQSLFAALQSDTASVEGITLFAHDATVLDQVGMEITPSDSLLNATVIMPIIGREGWLAQVVTTPVRSTDNTHLGTLAVRYQVQDFLQEVVATNAHSGQVRVLLAMQQANDVVLLNHPVRPGIRLPLILGSLQDQLQYGLPLATALQGKEGIGQGEDYQGHKVLSAYRTIPELGWALAVEMDRKDVLGPVASLSLLQLAISIAALLLGNYLAYLLAKRLTTPIRHLSTTMSTLGPGKWRLARQIHTGDEVELLETVASDMAVRLKTLYEAQEQEIEETSEKLQAAQIKDRAILQTIDHGVLVVDTKGVVIDANDAALDSLKCDGSACYGRTIVEAFDIRLHHSTVKKTEHPVLQCLKQKKPIKSTPAVRYSAMRNDDVLVPVSLVVNPLLQGKKLIGAVAVFQDVTEERRVDYLKSEFISLASHQLRTPLSSLQWYLELLAEEGVAKNQHEYVSEMQLAARRMSNLINALLHAARLEGGDITPHTCAVDVTTLITDLAQELRSLAKEKKIACTVDVPEEKVLIETDSVLLHVVFKNLFSNAVKYTPSGKEVGVSMTLEGKTVAITVSDQGVGVPIKEQQRLFERLFRASNVRKLDTDGNGLGLYISKMIVDSLNGSITFDSKEDQGSTFTVVLPLTTKKKKKRN